MMINRRLTYLAFLMFAVIISFSCSGDKDENEIPDPDPVPAPAEPNPEEEQPENTITIAGASYTLNNGKYYSGNYPFMGLDCTNYYIECSSTAGITIEIDESLVGDTIPIEKGVTFWFLAIGNGQRYDHVFVPLQNDCDTGTSSGLKYKTDDYSGWFKLTRDLVTDECSLLFVINKNSYKKWAMGNIKDTFVRMPSL